MARQHRGREGGRVTNSVGSGVGVELKLYSPTSHLVTWDKPFATLSRGFPICEAAVLAVPGPGFAVRVQ